MIKKILGTAFVVLFMFSSPVAFSVQQSSGNNNQTNYKKDLDVLDKVTKETEYQRKNNEVKKSASTGRASAYARKAASVGRASAQMAKRYGKGGLGGILGGYALDKILEATDFVLDEKNNRIIKKPDDDLDPRIEYYYQPKFISGSNLQVYLQDRSDKFSSESELCMFFDKKYYAGGRKPIEFKELIVNEKCLYKRFETVSDAEVYISKVPNPAYKPDYQPDQISQSELEGLFQKYLSSHQDADADQIMKNAYSDHPDGSELSQELAQEVRKAIQEAKQSPTGSSNITTKDKDGVEQHSGAWLSIPDSTGQEAGTEIGVSFGGSNQDQKDPESSSSGSPSPSNTPSNNTQTEVTTGSPNEMPVQADKPKKEDWPEYCSWADVHCKWMEWTKEEPKDLKDEKPEIEEEKVEKFEEYSVQFGKQCPFKSEKKFLGSKVLGMEYEKDLTPFCTVASGSRPYVIAIGYLVALLLIIKGVRGV